MTLSGWLFTTYTDFAYLAMTTLAAFGFVCATAGKILLRRTA